MASLSSTPKLAASQSQGDCTRPLAATAVPFSESGYPQRCFDHKGFWLSLNLSQLSGWKGHCFDTSHQLERSGSPLVCWERGYVMNLRELDPWLIPPLALLATSVPRVNRSTIFTGGRIPTLTFARRQTAMVAPYGSRSNRGPEPPVASDLRSCDALRRGRVFG
jgi:hypothetical protein